MSGKFSPSPQVSDPDMHHGTCVSHVPWCMPGSLTSGFLWNRRRGKTFPAFPAHAQPAILRICKEAHVREFSKFKIRLILCACVFVGSGWWMIINGRIQTYMTIKLEWSWHQQNFNVSLVTVLHTVWKPMIQTFYKNLLVFMTKNDEISNTFALAMTSELLRYV